MSKVGVRGNGEDDGGKSSPPSNLPRIDEVVACRGCNSGVLRSELDQGVPKPDA